MSESAQFLLPMSVFFLDILKETSAGRRESPIAQLVRAPH